MKKFTLLISCCLLLSGVFAQQSIDARVDAIMAKMDLTDKVGEMTQLTIDMLSAGKVNRLKEPHQLDKNKMREALVKYRVGSVLNAGGHAYSLEHWREIIPAIQKMAMEEKASGIPVLYGIDAIHGTNYTLGATLFPQQIGLAATWAPELAYETGRITAYETKASYIPWNFSPVLDIGRDPRWPRLWETFGEDVHLASVMGVEMVKGNQGDELSDPYRVAACMKHFLGYSVPLTGKDRTQAWIPERQLKEYIIPTFQKAVDAGAATVMICSGEINGIPVHANKAILTDLLRDEMGFEGLAVSDWEDIVFLYERHHVAKDYKEAVKIAINAGIDMSMVPVDLEFPRLLKELVEEGEVPMARINEAVRRILKLKIQLGLFETPYPKDTNYDKFASAEHITAAYQAACESITLLENEDNTLPLSKSSKILVTGPTADGMLYLNGGWSRTWQGNDPKWQDNEKKTVLEAIQDEIGANNVTYIPGSGIENAIDIQAAVTAAGGVDAVVLCLGESSYTEKPGDLRDLNLPEAQVELAEAIAATGKPVILVLLEGRPRIIRDVVPHMEAILLGYLPGNEGGRAIADVLFGDVNPSGKLPYTYPRYANELLTYDHKGTDTVAARAGLKGFDPQFEFGHGLSYTTFEYSDLQLSAAEMYTDGKIVVSINVTNTGKRAGKEVVQLYVADKVASITPPVKRLRGFDKIALEAGETQKVSFTLTGKELAFVGQQNKWITEPGDFEVMIGGLIKKLTVK